MSVDFIPVIDPARCIGCELCVKLCPNNVLALVRGIAVVIEPESCNYTSICQEICPVEAINLTYEIVIGKGKNRRR